MIQQNLSTFAPVHTRRRAAPGGVKYGTGPPSTGQPEPEPAVTATGHDDLTSRWPISGEGADQALAR